MTRADAVDLVLLAALWGGSFLFMRVAAPEFGATPLVAVRVGVAAAVLIPILWWRGLVPALRTHAGPLVVTGLLNSALPFVLLAFATLHLSAGFTAVLNATTPMMGAIVARLWFGDRLDAARAAGLAIGFGGVAWLVGDRIGVRGDAALWAIAAALAATLCYGVAAGWVKRHLGGVPPLAMAAGSQLAASVALAPLALAFWPDTPPTARAWGAALALGIASTGLAYLIFFRLVARIGPVRAVTVTFLVPVFAMAWGALLLDEPVTWRMVTGTAVVLVGTALATGLRSRSRTLSA